MTQANSDQYRQMVQDNADLASAVARIIKSLLRCQPTPHEAAETAAQNSGRLGGWELDATGDGRCASLPDSALSYVSVAPDSEPPSEPAPVSGSAVAVTPPPVDERRA